MLRLGYELRGVHGGAILDVWVEHVMPLAVVTWDAVALPARPDSCWGSMSACAGEEELDRDLCRGGAAARV